MQARKLPILVLANEISASLRHYKDIPLYYVMYIMYRLSDTSNYHF